MKSFGQVVLLAALFLQRLPALADDVITNFMSPTVSYQIPEDFSSEVLTNGGIQSSFISFQYLEDFGSTALTNGGIASPPISYDYLEDFAGEILTNGVVLSPFVSYQYPENFNAVVLTNGGVLSPFVSYNFPDNFNALILTNGGVLSPVVSYQFYEWATGIFNLQSSRTVSYYFPGIDTLSVTLHGQITETGGAPLAGAVISAAFGSIPVASTSAAANGNYSISLGTGVYALTVTAPGHANASRALVLNAATAAQNFQLAALPAAPAVVQVTRQPTASAVPAIGALGETLEIFNGTQFVAVDATHKPSPSQMTIVLTHGWNSDPTMWTQSMAANMVSQGISANILAWDWRYASEGVLPPEENTPSEGVQLGKALQTALGTTYSQPIHFIGHSLGTMVNAAAANYLHGDRTAQQEVSPTPWLASRTHMTLFDQAEISSVAGASVLFDGLTVNVANPADVLKYAAQTLQQWKPSMPVQSVWADNYISLVGFYLPNTFNVALQKAEGIAALQAAQESSDPAVIALKTLAYAHGYPVVWYSNSIANPTDTPLGFQQSREYDQLAGLPASTFPSALYQLGDAYHQVPLAADQLALEPLPAADVFQAIVPLFGNGADAVVQGLVGTAQAYGQAAANVEAAAQSAGQAMAQGFNYVGNAAVQGANGVANFLNSAVVRVSLTTSFVFPPLVRPNFPTPQGAPSGGGASNAPAMIWLPLQIPTNAAAMAFDFIITGNPADDWLVCGIGTNNLFSLEAKYIPTNTISASRLIDVTAWAGKTNELFFGFLGGTSTNATLAIDNIRFYSLQLPTLQASVSGGSLILSWPMSAQNFSLQTTTNLADPNSWVTLTNGSAIVNFQNTVTNAVFDEIRFYRLKQ